MKLSKTTFFSAALLFAGSCLASAVHDITSTEQPPIKVDSQMTEDYYVSAGGKLTLELSGTHTFYGKFLGSTSQPFLGLTLANDYANGSGYYNLDAAGGKIEITGNGTFEYFGFDNINYYSSTYLTTNGQPHGIYEQEFTDSLVGIDQDGEVDGRKTAFSGQLTVSKGAKVVVGSYLSQFVSYGRPWDSSGLTGSPTTMDVGYVGVANLVLKDTASVSFAAAPKNMLSMPFELGDIQTGAPIGAEGVRRLNFLNNVKADINTTIELGVDEASTSRIVIATDADGARKDLAIDYGWDGESTIGILSGTGRVYFVNSSNDADVSGRVSITNRAEFATLSKNAGSVPTLSLQVGNEASVLDYVHNLSSMYDLTGNKLIEIEGEKVLTTGVLADVFLLTDTILGTDSTGAHVVDNVLETATAVQFDAYFVDTVVGQVDGAMWENAPGFVDEGGKTAGTITIAGTQILNNLQSLFFERETLREEAEANGDGYYEITRFFSTKINVPSSDVEWNPYRTSAGTKVFVKSDGALIINQQEGRDGIFAGRFFTTDASAQNLASAAVNDGYIIKTGAGTFANLSNDDTAAIINRLFIYEGTWMADVGSLGSGRVYVGDSGTLRIIQNYTDNLRARIEGSSMSNLVFAYNSSYTETTESGEEIFHGGISSDGREFVIDTRSSDQGWAEVDSDSKEEDFGSPRGTIQVLAAQNDFKGSVTVNDGMTLMLGFVGNNELDSVFSSASKIELVEDAKLSVASYQILPQLIGGENSQLAFTGDSYDAVAVLAGAGAFTGDITGAGTLVKVGLPGLTLGKTEHQLATVNLVGQIRLDEESALRASSGLVLANSGTISASKSQSFAALIGSANTRVALADGTTLSVGLDDESRNLVKRSIGGYYANPENGKIAYDAYYFATADSRRYLGDDSSELGLRSVLLGSNALRTLEGLGKDRPAYMHVEEGGKEFLGDFTVAETINYIKDPAKFANVFAHLYATIDSETFDSMAESSLWSGLGIQADTLKGVFDTVLKLDDVKKFVAGKPAGWTARELEDLLAFAEDYDADQGASLFVKESLSGQVTLNRDGYRNLQDANVVKYISTFGAGLSAADLSQAETFYGFITLFVDDYQFRLTEENVALLSTRYGLPTEAIFTAKTSAEKYAEFEKIIGVQCAEGELPGFAGTIEGAVTLNKIGTETLTLTGKNTYTGATLVKGGELRVDHDAIRYTEEIIINKTALLTIVSDGTLEESVFDADVETNAGLMASPIAAIRGEGTILKDGEGTLRIAQAFSHAPDSAANDFTGEFVVGKGNLVINIAADTEDENGNVVETGRKSFAETVNVYLNKGTTFELDIAEGAELTFNGQVVGGAPLAVSDTESVTSFLAKSGKGKLILANGDALSKATNEFALAVKAGEMEVQLNGNGAFRNEAFQAVLGQNAQLTFNVADGSAYTLGGLVLAEIDENGKAVSGTTFVKNGAGTLTLTRADAANTWTIDNLHLAAGELVIDSGAEYQFAKITTDKDTTFRIDGTFIVSGEESNVFNGKVVGSGTLEKVGVSTLQFTDFGFEGTVKLSQGAFEINVAENDAGTVTELNFGIEPGSAVAANSMPTLIKTGAGAATFTKTVDWTSLTLDVQEGALELSGATLSGTNPYAIKISKDATLGFNGHTFDLADTTQGLSGEGTLALAAGTLTVSDAAKISAFSGTVDVASDATLNVTDAALTALGGISGAGTVKLATTEETLTLKPNRDVTFTGTLDTTAKNVVLDGTGTLLLSDGTNRADLTGITSIEVQSGGIGVGLDNTTGVTLSGNGSQLTLVGAVSGTTVYNGAVTTAGDVKIALEGEMDLSQAALEKLMPNFSKGEGTAITLANAQGKDLILKTQTPAIATQSTAAPVVDIAAGFTLATNAGGSLVLDTTATENAKYAKDIAGAGNLEKSGSGTLLLSSATQSYTGQTIVSGGTLAFNSGTTLATSGIVVKSGATLQGGIVLTGESVGVVFEEDASYKLDVSKGEALEYAGDLDISGTLTLDIELDQMDRGKALPIFKYTGAAEDAKELGVDAFGLGASDELLYIDTTGLKNGNLSVYVAQDNFNNVGADLHDGIDDLVDILSAWAKPVDGKLANGLSDEEAAIADALNKTSLGELGDAITNLSPLAYASMVTMPHAGFTSDVRSISGRLEQRLYDSTSAVWVYNEEWEFFAQAQGSTVDGGSDSDSMVYDYNTYGALVGADLKLNKEATVGFALAYDHGKADIQANGGEIESDNFRATAFAGYMINPYLAVNFGAQVGYADYKIERNTLIDKVDGDTDGWQGGLFADFVGAYVLHTWGDSGHLDLLPHAGLAFSYYRVDKFEETSSRKDDLGASLATDSFDAFSLQARIGATLNCAFEIGDHATRLGLDFSLVHEFLDDEVEIDAWISDSKFTTDARALSQTSFAVAPSVSFDLTEKTTLYLNYELSLGSEAEVGHRANLGFRHRF